MDFIHAQNGGGQTKSLQKIHWIFFLVFVNCGIELSMN